MKDRNIRRLAFCLALLLCLPALLCGCGGVGTGTDGTEAPRGMQNAAPQGAAYYLFVPEDWLVDRRDGITVVSVSSYATASITLADFSSDKTPAEYWDASREETEARFTEITMKEDGKNAAMGGVAALRYAFSGKYHDGNVYSFLQCIAKKDGRLYVLTYTASEAEYDTYLSGANTIIENFRFAEKAESEAGNAPNTEGAPAGMQQISRDDIHEFRFYAPLSWVADMQTGYVSAYVSAEDRTNVSLVAHYPPSGVADVDAYFATMEDERKSLLSDYTLLSGGKNEDGTYKDPVAVAGGKGARYVYEGTNGGVTYRVMQVFFVRSAYIYTFTYTATAELYETHLAEAEAVLAAITFEK